MVGNKLCEMSKRTEKVRLRLLKGSFFKFKEAQPHYIEVMQGCIYQTSPMETLLIDFDKKASRYKALKGEKY